MQLLTGERGSGDTIELGKRLAYNFVFFKNNNREQEENIRIYNSKQLSIEFTGYTLKSVQRIYILTNEHLWEERDSFL